MNVERGRYGAAVAEVAQPQLGTCELPLRVGVVLHPNHLTLSDLVSSAPR